MHLAATNATPLRISDHRRLLRLLKTLAHDDADRRATAALEVSQLLYGKGLVWKDLFPPPATGNAVDDAMADALPDEPGDWRSKALLLLAHGELTKAEHEAVKKIIGWRVPGHEGMDRLRFIAGRCGMEALFSGR